MKGQRIGYTRVSSVDQNLDRQLDGIALDKVFADKVSGKDTARPQLQAMLEFVREGDTVLVHSIDRLARNMVDLLSIVQRLVTKKVSVQFMKESLTFTHDKQDPTSQLLLHVLGAAAEFERSIILERQREGIAIAKQKGVYRGRKAALTPEQKAELRTRAKDLTVNRAELAREYGISRATLYKALGEPAPGSPELAAAMNVLLAGTPHAQA